MKALTDSWNPRLCWVKIWTKEIFQKLCPNLYLRTPKTLHSFKEWNNCSLCPYHSDDNDVMWAQFIVWIFPLWCKFWCTFSHQYQVWPLTQFFLFPFYKKIFLCLEGKSMTPCRGNTYLSYSFHQLPCLRLGPLKGFLSWHDALQGTSTRLVRFFWNYWDTRTPSGVQR